MYGEAQNPHILLMLCLVRKQPASQPSIRKKKINKKKCGIQLHMAKYDIVEN